MAQGEHGDAAGGSTPLADTAGTLPQDHPYGFWAKPKKAADGTLDMKTWETGIPGREGVSGGCCAARGNRSDRSSMVCADDLGGRHLPRYFAVSGWCAYLCPSLSTRASPELTGASRTAQTTLQSLPSVRRRFRFLLFAAGLH